MGRHSALVTRRTLFLVVAAVSSASANGSAQVRSVGVVGGALDSTQLWPGGRETEPRAGIVAGAYAEGSTPLTWLRVVAETAYVQRGGNVRLRDVADDTALGELPPGTPEVMPVRIEYLTVSAFAVVRVSVGPAAVYALGGPSFDSQLRSRAAQPLEPAYLEERSPGFTMSGGIGAELRFGRWLAAVEARRGETISPAFSGPVGDLRHRTTETVVRLGRQP